MMNAGCRDVSNVAGPSRFCLGANRPDRSWSGVGSRPPGLLARALREIVLFAQRRGVGGGHLRGIEPEMMFDRLVTHDGLSVVGGLFRAGRIKIN